MRQYFDILSQTLIRKSKLNGINRIVNLNHKITVYKNKFNYWEEIWMDVQTWEVLQQSQRRYMKNQINNFFPPYYSFRTKSTRLQNPLLLISLGSRRLQLQIVSRCVVCVTGCVVCNFLFFAFTFYFSFWIPPSMPTYILTIQLSDNYHYYPYESTSFIFHPKLRCWWLTCFTKFVTTAALLLFKNFRFTSIFIYLLFMLFYNPHTNHKKSN